MKSGPKPSDTMRIDIPPYLPRGESAPKPGTGRKVVRRQVPSITVLRRTDQIPIEDADFKVLFQGLYDAAFITRLKGRIIDANARACDFFGYSRKDFREHNIMDIVVGLDESVLHTICENLAHDQFTLIQAHCLRKDGGHFPAEISTSRLRLSTRECLCFFIRDITARREAEENLRRAHASLEAEVAERARINADLTAEIAERKRIEAELQSAIAKLQEHDRAKTEFVSNVSHELKTPLTSISYAAGNLLKGLAGPLPEAACPYLRMIREDCDRLRRTVEDILDMSRAEAGTLKMARLKTNFSRFVRATAESMRLQIESAELSLVVRIDLDKCFVACDPQKMERVIFNIVKNAIKYNVPHGSIGVCLRTGSRQGTVAVEVTDTGIGIAPEHLPHVTERFFRIGEHVSGAGLGLSICKEIMEKHGGGIEVRSPPPGMSKGTQVTAWLPWIAPPECLIITSEDRLLLSAMKEMDAYGYSIVHARTLEEGKTALGGRVPDLVAVDWTGDNMEGGVVIAQIRADPAWGATPVIAFTRSGEAGPKKEILQGLGIPMVETPWQAGALECSLDGLVMLDSSPLRYP